MKKIQVSTLLLFAVVAMALTGCSDDDDNSPEPDGHHDETHALIVRLTDENGEEQEFEFNAEHDHGDDTEDDHNHGEEQEMMLSTDHTYQAQLLFLNEEGEDITDNIHADEHLVCFDADEALTISVNRTDVDVNGLEVGLESTWTTGAASEGHLVIEVRHQIDKSEFEGEDCALGGTDVEAEFHVHIE